MKNPTTTGSLARRRAGTNPKHDLRAWCARLECTELEVRDTLRALLRLMASPSWHQVLH
jgi:hypothetical protein